MRFGVCCSLADVRPVLDAGYDYLELGASGFGGMSDEWDPSPFAGLPIHATNLFFDSRIKLFGPERTPYREYAVRTIERAASLGVSLMVIGSGASRRAPDGVDGDALFVDLVAELAELARGHGIALAPESLNRPETNVGNDLGKLALGLQARGVGYTADSYHVLYEWDSDGRKCSMEELMQGQMPFAPSHVHIANLPRTGVEAFDPMLRAFAGRLSGLGYSEAVSLECSRGEDFDLAGALGALKALFGGEGVRE